MVLKDKSPDLRKTSTTQSHDSSSMFHAQWLLPPDSRSLHVPCYPCFLQYLIRFSAYTIQPCHLLIAEVPSFLFLYLLVSMHVKAFLLCMFFNFSTYCKVLLAHFVINRRKTTLFLVKLTKQRFLKTLSHDIKAKVLNSNLASTFTSHSN